MQGDKDLEIHMTMRQALTLLTVCMEAGLYRHGMYKHLREAETALASAIANSPKPNTTAPGQELNDTPTRDALNNYETGDNCL